MVSSGGFILGLIGGVLDFASASMLLIGRATGSGMMGESSSSAYIWAAVLIVLGAVVMVTTLLSVATMSTRMGRAAPLLMTTYGVIMTGIGTAMAGGYVVNEGMSLLYSYGMVLVGVLMVANGIIMLKGQSPMNTA